MESRPARRRRAREDRARGGFCPGVRGSGILDARHIPPAASPPMLSAIKQFFDRQIRPEATRDDGEHAIRLATAALLIEVMRANYQVSEGERRAVLGALEGKFDLSTEETHTLVTLAEREAEEATDYYQFTSLINREFNREQKRRVMEALWRVAYADGHIDKYERHLLRKLGELLYIPHADYIAAKERARAAAAGGQA
jgi:uncharacterized tellurite resistance protein B-like protein